MISLDDGNSLRVGSFVWNAARECGGIAEAEQSNCGWNSIRLRNGLAVAQIAIAIMLLIGAGLMAKSFWALVHTAPGFRSEDILTARVSLPRSRYPDNRRIAAFERELLDRLRGRPGIQSAGFTTYLPLSGSDNGWSFFVEGRPPLPVGVYNMAKYRPVSAGYFETIGIPLLKGRSFTPADTARIAVGGGDQRLNGARVLGRSEPGRAADAFCRTDVADGGRGRRRCAARGAGRRGEGGDVYAGRAGG